MDKKEIKFPNLLVEMVKSGEKQKELGNLLGLTNASISRKLSGKTEWSLKEVDAICEHYGKDYKELFK